jgi:hypothetical protein
MKNEVMSSNKSYSESKDSEMSASIDNLDRLIKAKDSEIAALTRRLKESDAKYH